MEEKILYTDGHDVTVTDSTLRVRKHFYRLDRIIRHNFSIVKPNRIPALFFLSLGVMGLMVGFASISQPSNFEFRISSSSVLGLSEILAICGTILIISGIASMISMKEKYGVHIVTDKEEKDVLVSDRREYVSKIVDALNKAYINMLRKTNNDSMVGRHKEMSVSHR